MLASIKNVLSLLVVTGSLLITMNAADAQPMNGRPSDMAVHGGDIVGVITRCGAPLNRALVYIPGHSFQARTNHDGSFKLNYVQPGTYPLVVELKGEVATHINSVRVVKNKITDIGTNNFCVDVDGDGADQLADCDDNNPHIYPQAEEVCDGVDNNCDGAVDTGCLTCSDNDQDGFFAQQGCNSAVDCDDTKATINPYAKDTCFDSIDNNCNGIVDENCLTCTPGSSCSTGNVGACSTGSYDQSCSCVATTSPTAESCNGLDDDCDGTVDNGGVCGCPSGTTSCSGSCVNLATNNLHCGACGNSCPSGFACSAGACVSVVTCTPTTCAAQGANCGIISNGCGALINCGACSSGLLCGGVKPNVCG